MEIEEFQVTREDMLALSQDANWLGVGILYLPLVDLVPDPPSGAGTTILAVPAIILPLVVPGTGVVSDTGTYFPFLLA